MFVLSAIPASSQLVMPAFGDPFRRMDLILYSPPGFTKVAFITILVAQQVNGFCHSSIVLLTIMDLDLQSFFKHKVLQNPSVSMFVGRLP